MKPEYETYCLADPDFYDVPSESAGDGPGFGITARPMPPGWFREASEDWLLCRLEGVELPRQGWKVHASACLGNAEKILEAVWESCISRGVPFKYLRDHDALRNRNLKYAPRGHSGKLATMYPAGEEQLQEIIEGIDALIGGEPGPYILSDLRWKAGPLYVRYGGFTARQVLSDKGVLEPAIETPDGTLVPDRRGPSFVVPPWVTLPGFLAEQLAARGQDSLAEVPYAVRRALHFSNGGGVYLAEDTRTGREVVLKEARPYAGLTIDGKDAVVRLRAERDILRRLAGLDAVPDVLDYFTVGGHEFLVQEYVEGESLHAILGVRHPSIDASADPQGGVWGRVEYAEWALDICRRVEEAVAALHDRGVVFGDLHPFNVMVRPDRRVCLIDFEVAALVERNERSPIANPGFAAPRDRTGFAVDQYALACIRLSIFLPLTVLLRRNPGKTTEFAEVIAERFPVPREFLDSAVREILGERVLAQEAARGLGETFLPKLSSDRSDWLAVRESMARALLASATPSRDDRLFPGDIAQFNAGGGLNLAHGAAGVLYALDATGAGRYPEHEEWLIEHASRARGQTPLGFYDGLHGVAYVLDRLGHRDEALNVLDKCLSQRWEELGTDLFGGLSGIGLNLAHFAETTGDGALRDAAFRAADLVADRLGGETDVAEVSGGRHPLAGLNMGSSGCALLFLRFYNLSGDSSFLDLAATALRQDLRRCVVRNAGVLQVNEGARSMGYLGSGSAGVGLALHRYLCHRADDRFAEAAEGARRASRAEFYMQPNLFNGRAGTLYHLVETSPYEQPSDDPEVTEQIRQLNLHAVGYRSCLAFPGEQLLRLSMDLATGGAGILLALGAALHDTPVHLPFLGPAGQFADVRPTDVPPATEGAR